MQRVQRLHSQPLLLIVQVTQLRVLQVERP